MQVLSISLMYVEYRLCRNEIAIIKTIKKDFVAVRIVLFLIVLI